MSDTLDALALVEPIIEPDMPAERVLHRYDKWQAFVAAVKEADKLATASVTEWVKANGSLDAGEFTYALTHDKKTTCEDVPGAVTELLMVSQGDVEAFCRDFLSSGAVKYGAARQALAPEVFARLFKTVTLDKVEKQLKKIDKKFIK